MRTISTIIVCLLRLVLHCCLFRFLIHPSLLQFVFVTFTLFTFLDAIDGKPYASRDPDEGERLGNSTNNIFSQSEAATSGTVRTRRRVVLELSKLCRTPRISIKLSNGCEDSWYTCYGYREVKCKNASFGCLSSTIIYGFPKCEPVKDEVTINYEGETRRAKRTWTCRCAI